MLTVTVYFRVKDIYLMRSMEFNTSEKPEGLKNIHSIPEILRKSIVQSFRVEDDDVQVISREDYEEEIGEIEEEI